MTLRKIRLELARDHDFPFGSSEHGYEFVAPLDGDGHIDVEEWHKVKSHCRVHRFWNGEEDETGHLIRKPGGSWAFHYDVHGNDDSDSSGFRFGSHAFRTGELVSIREQDDSLRTFRVSRVTDAVGVG